MYINKCGVYDSDVKLCRNKGEKYDRVNEYQIYDAFIAFILGRK